MLIIATFRHSAYLELALKLLEQKGISQDKLLAAPLKKPSDKNKSEWKVVHQNGKSPYDLAFVFAMVFMLLGAIYGFILTWGPIIWSIIGLFIGVLFGLVLEYFIGVNPFKSTSHGESELVLMVHCDMDQSDTVETILLQHQVIGISKITNY